MLSISKGVPNDWLVNVCFIRKKDLNIYKGNSDHKHTVCDKKNCDCEVVKAK